MSQERDREEMRQVHRKRGVSDQKGQPKQADETRAFERQRSAHDQCRRNAVDQDTASPFVMFGADKQTNAAEKNGARGEGPMNTQPAASPENGRQDHAEREFEH